MRIITDNKNQKFIDQDLFNYIKKIWSSYDIEIPECSNIFFMKNTTINRLVTDYCERDIKRVIKKEKAEYCIIKKIEIGDYCQYYDSSINGITSDDTKEVVYGIYNLFPEQKECIEQIEWFINNNPSVIFVNQSKLNDSLNNGFVITNDNYTQIKELIDSGSSDNQKLAVSMLVNSNLKENWEWVLYLFHQKLNLLSSEYDPKNVILGYLNTLALGYTNTNIFGTIDSALKVVSKPEVKQKLKDIIRGKFQKSIEEYFNTLGTSKFKLLDYKIEYQE